MTEIFYELHAGGSGHGITWWLQWLDCAKRVHLDRECRMHGEPTSTDTWETGVGSLVHAYRELWYSGAHPNFDVRDVSFTAGEHPLNYWPWGRPIHPKQIVEAQNIFNAYMPIADQFVF